MSLDDVNQYQVLTADDVVRTVVQNYRAGYIDARSSCYAVNRVPACESGFENRPTTSSCNSLYVKQKDGCDTLVNYDRILCAPLTAQYVKLCRRKFPSGYTDLLAGLTMGSLPFEQQLCDKCCMENNRDRRNTNGCPISYYPVVTPLVVGSDTTSCYDNNLALCQFEGIESARCRLDRIHADDYTTLLKDYCITNATEARVQCAECIAYYDQNADPDVSIFLRAFCADKTRGGHAEYDLICGCFYSQQYYDTVFADLWAHFQQTAETPVVADPQPHCWFPNCANGMVKRPYVPCTSVNFAICIQDISIGTVTGDGGSITLTNDCELLQAIADPAAPDPEGWLQDQAGYFFKYSDAGIKYIQPPDRSMMYYIRPDTLADIQEVLVFGDVLDPDYLWIANHDTGVYQTTFPLTGRVYYYSTEDGTWYIHTTTGERVYVERVGDTETDWALIVTLIAVAVAIVIGVLVVATRPKHKTNMRI